MEMAALPQLKLTSPCMEKLDRLGWAAGMTFSIYGSRIGIRVNDAATLQRLPKHLPPGCKFESSPSPFVNELYSLFISDTRQEAKMRRYNLLYRGSGRLARTLEVDKIFETLECDLHYAATYMAHHKICVYAGVVGWHGRAIVILGDSRSGKTTLVEALVRAGATYYSDEYAVFDSRGHVHPYPKLLSVWTKGGERLEKYSVEAFGGRPGTKPLPVGLLVSTQYQPQARWRPRAVPAGQTALMLIDSAVAPHKRPDYALATLHRVASGALTIKGKRGEAQIVAEVLLNRLSATPGPMPLCDR